MLFRSSGECMILFFFSTKNVALKFHPISHFHKRHWNAWIRGIMCMLFHLGVFMELAIGLLLSPVQYSCDKPVLSTAKLFERLLYNSMVTPCCCIFPPKGKAKSGDPIFCLQQLYRPFFRLSCFAIIEARDNLKWRLTNPFQSKGIIRAKENMKWD